jgi:hypothetical protein
MKTYLYILFILLTLPSVLMANEQPAGSIKTLENDVSVLRGEQKLAAVIGMAVYPGDVIETSTSGTVGIILRDDALVSLGPDSKLNMKNFVFEPEEEKFSILIKIFKGTLVYISGAIGKLSPDSVKLETPSSIIGTRGTKVLIEVKGI